MIKLIRIRVLKCVTLMALICCGSLAFGQRPSNQGGDIKISEPNANLVPPQPVPVVDVLPEYPGGSAMMRQFVGNNLKYPKAAQKADVQGTVIAEFWVNTDGKIDRIKIKRSLGYGTDEEVIRVLKKMPKWKPAQLNGRATATTFTLPFSFKLSD